MLLIKNKIAILITLVSANLFSQETVITEKYTASNKGKIYFYWGGNREVYSKSDIQFTGENYNLTVNNVVADDKPKGWHVDYINPARMTIPQTNFRLGYFLNNIYHISIGVDHMKYVMRQTQIANVTGTINLPLTESGSVYNGNYNHTPVDFEANSLNEEVGTPPFLTFEHTDGLNYINTEFGRMDDISSKIFKNWNSDKIQINLTEAFGAGILYPKTNAKLLGKERHDDFHVSGFGVSAKAGLNINFFKYFFIQTEVKGGYINMSDIRTSHNVTDKASQNFWFLQNVIAFGGIFKI